MSAAFQFQLTLIVLMNVMFVHITGSVGLNWLVPMYVLTLAAPLLVRLQDKLTYRIAWNVGVVIIFGVLMVDAATTGITFLLEDGLILAAFCQVHLLNVIKRQTGADLLYFNSFLIALVTSLFCQDIVFSAVFAIYAIVLLTTLHMSTMVTVRMPVPKAVMHVISVQGLRRALLTLVVTGLVFAFFPRDFNRQGFVGDDLLQSADAGSVGFSEEVRLGQSSATPVRRHVVMRIRVLDGNVMAVPELWRGATLGFFDRGGWQGVHLPQDTAISGTDADWKVHEGRTWTRTKQGHSIAKLRVSCTVPVPPRLFAPLGAHTVELDRQTYVEPLVDATLRYHSGPPLAYEVEVEHGSIGKLSVSHLDGYRQLDRRNIPAAMPALLLAATRALPSDSTRMQIVDACTDFLSNRFNYLLPGERGAAHNLDEFLSGAGGGHCEYFATALAVMLRMRQIPCRVVTGYRVNEWDEQAREFIVRDAHAHAWVEVWDPEFGWIAADATPAAALPENAESWWESVRQALDGWWSALVQFDSTSHGAALAWLFELPALACTVLIESPVTTITALLVLLWLALARRRQRSGRLTDAARRYRATLRRARVMLEAGETPRELLLRVAADGEVSPDLLEQLRTATSEHERCRYGPES